MFNLVYSRADVQHNKRFYKIQGVYKCHELLKNVHKIEFITPSLTSFECRVWPLESASSRTKRGVCEKQCFGTVKFLSFFMFEYLEIGKVPRDGSWSREIAKQLKNHIPFGAAHAYLRGIRTP